MFNMPDDRYIRSRNKPRHYASSEQQLEQYHIEVGQVMIRAKRDDDNHVYWVLPGCKTTYQKATAVDAAKNVNQLLVRRPSESG